VLLNLWRRLNWRDGYVSVPMIQVSASMPQVKFGRALNLLLLA
jgi:hypothetical protein